MPNFRQSYGISHWSGCGGGVWRSAAMFGMKVHRMHELFEMNSSNGVGMFLVDAKNAFNSVSIERWLCGMLWSYGTVVHIF